MATGIVEFGLGRSTILRRASWGSIRSAPEDAEEESDGGGVRNLRASLCSKHLVDGLNVLGGDPDQFHGVRCLETCVSGNARQSVQLKSQCCLQPVGGLGWVSVGCLGDVSAGNVVFLWGSRSRSVTRQLP